MASHSVAAAAAAVAVLAAVTLLLCVPQAQTAAVQHKVSAPNGYIVNARYYCGPGCQKWELDVSRQSLVFQEHETVQLINLLPAAPASNMSFPVITAFDSVDRIFWTAGTVRPGHCTIWGVKLSNDVANATLAATFSFQFAKQDDVLTRIHVYGPVLIGIFANGQLVNINPFSGTVAQWGNVLPSPAFQYGSVTPASIIVNDVFYGVIKAQYEHNTSFIAYDCMKGEVISVAPISFKLHNIMIMNFFDLQYISDQDKYLLFSQGKFDQLFWVDPATGKMDPLVFNLAEYMMEFDTDPVTKADDTLQTVCYDVATKTLYFQVTYYESQDDDSGITSIAMLRMPVDIPNLAISPYTYGTQGFQFVPLQ